MEIWCLVYCFATLVAETLHDVNSSCHSCFFAVSVFFYSHELFELRCQLYAWLNLLYSIFEKTLLSSNISLLKLVLFWKYVKLASDFNLVTDNLLRPYHSRQFGGVFWRSLALPGGPLLEHTCRTSWPCASIGPRCDMALVRASGAVMRACCHFTACACGWRVWLKQQALAPEMGAPVASLCGWSRAGKLVWIFWIHSVFLPPLFRTPKSLKRASRHTLSRKANH